MACVCFWYFNAQKPSFCNPLATFHGPAVKLRPKGDQTIKQPPSIHNIKNKNKEEEGNQSNVWHTQLYTKLNLLSLGEYGLPQWKEG